MGGELKEVAIPDVRISEVELPLNITSKVKLWKNAIGAIGLYHVKQEYWDSKSLFFQPSPYKMDSHVHGKRGVKVVSKFHFGTKIKGSFTSRCCIKEVKLPLIIASKVKLWNNANGAIGLYHIMLPKSIGTPKV